MFLLERKGGRGLGCLLVGGAAAVAGMLGLGGRWWGIATLAVGRLGWRRWGIAALAVGRGLGWRWWVVLLGGREARRRLRWRRVGLLNWRIVSKEKLCPGPRTRGEYRTGDKDSREELSTPLVFSYDFPNLRTLSYEDSNPRSG